MSDTKDVDNSSKKGQSEYPDTNITESSVDVYSVPGSVQTTKTHPRVASSSERQIKFERAQKCLENAALVSKRIKEHRKATAELLGRPFEDDDGGDTASEIASTMSERTGYSAATDTSTTMSVQEALNIPGISESLANTLKQKELLMERIKQYKEISKRPLKTTVSRRETVADSNVDIRKVKDNSDVIQLVNTIKEKENLLSVMQVKMKAMENTILDLQEKITEKDQIIEAKNKATTLISDSLSKKEKDSWLLLEDTRHQMTKMQENFVNMEAEWKEEKKKLLKEIEDKDEKISNLEEANTILENSRFDISVAHSKLVEEIESRSKEIMDLQERIEKLSHTEVQFSNKEKDVEDEKGSLEIANMVDLTKKIELLEQLNCQMRQTNKELENKLTTINPEPKSTASVSPSKKGSPVATRKGRNTASKIKSPWSHLSTESLNQDSDKKVNKEGSKFEMMVQSLNKDILDKEYLISQKEAIIAELHTTIAQNECTINDLKLHLQDRPAMVDIHTETADIAEPDVHNITVKNVEIVEGELEYLTTADAKELEDKFETAQDQIAALNEEIDAANKNMIKVKSNHKLKLKQMQKTIDNFSKVSDSNAEIVKLNEELHQLSQKVAELEEEKGNLQLHLVDYDSGRLTESDIYKKMLEKENLAEARLKAISVLEAQKFDLVQELHELQQKYDEIEDKLADISQFQSEQVSSEIKSVQLEEQVDQLSAVRKELELVIENLKRDKEQLHETNKLIEDEKEELGNKLEHYIQENMELTDKLEKLSAEKVSSAESIEMVESLTSQEKLELEEYNKGMVEHKIEDSHAELPASKGCDESIEKLKEQSAELSSRIELFTLERQEVMEKMSEISSENKSLHESISELNAHRNSLQNNIDLLCKEKDELVSLNEELNHQLDDLKRERIEIMKDSIEIAKPADDMAEGTTLEAQHDDKVSSDKGNNRTKSVKQLTKEILKLKNTIKEREAEIGDCQMKILSLEEQEQKQKELIQSNACYESKLKSLIDENIQLKEELESVNENTEFKQQLHQIQHANEFLQQEIQKLRHDYSSTVKVRDARIHELENLLVEYEKQIFNYGNSLQQKDKEMVEYINQITKLNDVSQKLKSTIEVLEEEKSKDLNAELVKSLNKQVSVYQKKLSECEERIRILEDEKSQLLALKVTMENKNNNIETELKKLHETFTEKQNLIQELQAQQQNHAEEISNIILQVKERDEEVHEVKLQLRKESIENEKLRTSLSEKDNSKEEIAREFEDTKEKASMLFTENVQLREQYVTMETKNKELMEKLKKFAASVKKKSSMYTELENNLNATQKELEAKNELLDQLTIQIEILPTLQDKLKHAEEELTRLQSLKVTLEQQKSNDILQSQTEIKTLEDKLSIAMTEITKLKESQILLQKESMLYRDENEILKTQTDTLNNKLADHDIEQKNNTNFITKITSLEADLNQKQIHIVELLHKLESQEQQLNQLQFGQEAKLQERDLYIESLESEINRYKNRIGRLEESISIMEGRRHSLERKADQLDSQLQEKQKAYAEYTNQEDQLVGRLAVLMDHDRVVEKQLYEIEGENKELQNKIQHVNEENQRLRKSLSDIQEYCNTLVDKASKADFAESEIATYQSKLRELESQLKRITHEHQNLLVQKKQHIEELETEFNVQIENSFKEKKALSEKYEKFNDHVIQLEKKLQEYRSNIENLNMNIEDLTRINQQLVEKSNQEQVQTPDYTEQYISEINKLNSDVASKNNEIIEVNKKLQTLQANDLRIISNLENKITELNSDLLQSTAKINNLIQESNIIRINNDHLNTKLFEKEQQIRQLIEKKTVTFEMSIPKTEGMIISSTIEPLNDVRKEFDISTIESQIISEPSPSVPCGKSGILSTEQVQKQYSDKEASSQEIVEEVIVPKKAYLCYEDDEKNPEQPDDPFNSDEGWGLGEPEDIEEVTPGLSHLHEQMNQLKKSNEALKADLDASNNKLLKALKKLKEIKANNDMLTNELNLSKHMPQSSFLDSAIEDELKINIQGLEKKIEEITVELNKEKREKDSLRKQNEIFSSANDRLTEMKEKMENEIELWKYKFKEANDKVSTLQWDSKDSPVEMTPSNLIASDSALRDEIIKLENENEECQSIIDQLTTQNKELSSQQAQLAVELNDLRKQLQQSQTSLVDYNTAKSQLFELQNCNTDLLIDNNMLNKKIQNIETQYIKETEQCEQLKIEKEENIKELQLKYKELLATTYKLEEEIQCLRTVEVNLLETQKINADLLNNNNLLNQKLQDFEDQYSEILLQYEQLKVEKGNIINEFEVKNKELLDRNYKLEEEIQLLRGIEVESKNLISELETFKLQHAQQSTHHSQGLDTMAIAQRYSEIEDYCSQLKQNLHDSNTKISQLETTNLDLLQKSKDYEDQLKELNAKIQHLNIENDQLLATVAELRSSVSSAVDQRGYEIAEIWKQHLSQREADFQQTEQELRSQLNASEVKYEQLLDNVQSSTQEETSKLITMEQVASLQNKLQDKDEHLRNLQDKCAELVSQLDVLRSEIEDEKIMLENKLMAQQDEYEKQIQELSVTNQKHTEGYEDAYRELQSELAASKIANEELTQQNKELLTTTEKIEENVLDLMNQLRLKDNEIYQKTHDYTITLAQRNEELENLRRHLLDYEKKIEDLSYEKEADLAVLRLKMHEQGDHYGKVHCEFEAEKTNLLEALNAKVVECTNLNKQLSELNKTLEKQASNITEMQTALENQEFEIVTLKDEIAELTDTLRSSTSKIEKHVTFASDTKPGADGEKSESGVNKELLDAVPRAELDLALYMLHQRDVRCEELTMELTHLLEERDTLQLRLSDCLRSYEDLKTNCKAAGLDVSMSSSQETVSELLSFGAEKEQQFVDVHRGQTSRSSSVSDPDGENLKLQAKLSELRTVKHSRDVTFRHESEQRQLDLRLLQRDVANLPPEAIDQLTQAHHTLSRDSQSTSTVLLNWLRGKSTPKVVHM